MNDDVIITSYVVTVDVMKAFGHESHVLAQVIDAAGGDTITFAPGLSGTITLASTIDINKNLAISGKGTTTISGGHIAGVFEVAPDTTVSIAYLTIRDGNDASGGGILNRGTRTVAARSITMSARH